MNPVDMPGGGRLWLSAHPPEDAGQGDEWQTPQGITRVKIGDRWVVLTDAR